MKDLFLTMKEFLLVLLAKYYISRSERSLVNTLKFRKRADLFNSKSKDIYRLRKTTTEK